MTVVDLAVTGGTVVTGAGEKPADVLIRDEKIVAIVPPGEHHNAAKVIDAAGKIVLPGKG